MHPRSVVVGAVCRPRLPSHPGSAPGRELRYTTMTRFGRAAVVIAMIGAIGSPAVASAAPAATQFPLSATVYDLRTGAPVQLVGRVRVGADVQGSSAQGWTVTATANLDAVTGTGGGLSYSATGSGSATIQAPPGVLPPSISFTPTFSLRAPSPAKAQPFQLLLVATLSARGKVSAVEVRPPAPPVSFAIDSTLYPDVLTVESPDGSAPRAVVRLADSLGGAMDYVADEMTIATDDPAVLASFVQRWNGQVLRTIEPPEGPASAVHVVRVDVAGADTTSLTATIAGLDPTAHGPHRASSAGALRLFAAAVQEVAAGHRVALNTLHAPQDYIDRRTVDAPTGANDPANGAPYDSNSANWSYMQDSATGFGVAEAWRILEVGGRLANRVRIGIIDVGCAQTNGDYPAGTSGGNGMPAVANDPWHCTNVATTAAGVPNNGFGTAGSGGPVADLRLYSTDMTDDNAAAQVYAASRDRVAMINLSFGANHPAIANLLDSNLEDAIEFVHDRGMLVFAAAGNARPGEASQDVDHMTCYFVCVEEAIIRPCEFDGVTCVGGLREGSHDRHPNSYYCLERRSSGVCDVDVYGPFTVYMGGTAPSNGVAGDNSLNRASITQGTSFSSPYVAGVAALMLAANPQLTNLQIEGILSNSLATTDPTVTAVVDARTAMTRAFVNVPPAVRITTPTDGSTVDYGAVNATRFVASTLDIEEGTDTLNVTWSSNVDGPMGSGRTLDYVFSTTGPRRVTATTTDRQGALGTWSILVTAANRVPVVTIVQPHANDTSPRQLGAPYTFRAEVQDQLNAPEPGLCSDTVWTSSDAADTAFPMTGCQISLAFTTTGYRDISATYTPRGCHRLGNAPHPRPGATAEQPARGRHRQPRPRLGLPGRCHDPAPRQRVPGTERGLTGGIRLVPQRSPHRRERQPRLQPRRPRIHHRRQHPHLRRPRRRRLHPNIHRHPHSRQTKLGRRRPHRTPTQP